MCKKGTEAVEYGPLLYWLFIAVFASVEIVRTALGSSSVPSPQHRVSDQTMQAGSCNYTILVETTCTDGAGTSGHVSLRFGDAASTDILLHPLIKSTLHATYVRFPSSGDGYDGTVVLNDMPADPFRECAIDVFEMRGQPCVRTPVCYVYLRHRGRDRWRPGRVQVVVEEGNAVGGPGVFYHRFLSSPVFYFRRWMPQNAWFGYEACGVKAVTPFGVERSRNTVITHRCHSHHYK